MYPIQGLNQKRAQVLNRILVLNIMRQAGVCSRSELARRANLRQATITNITKELLKLGYIRETGYLPGRDGRRSVGLTIDETRYRIVAARLTRKHFTVGLFTVLGTELNEEREKVSVASGIPGALDQMTDAVNRMVERAGREHVLGFGLCVPGPFIWETSHIALVTGFPGWDRISLRKEIAKRIDLPFFIEHDANAGAQAEWWIGAGKSSAFGTMVYIAAGQGLGAGIIYYGRPLYGAQGIAGEIGHQSICYDGPQCECGNRGCLELYCSTRTMIQQYKNKLEERSGNRIDREITMEDVAAGFLKQEASAVQVVTDTAGYLAVGIANIVNVVNPHLIVIGDEFPAFGDQFLEILRRKLAPLLLPEIFEGLKIQRSAFGDDAMIRGMAMIVAEKTLSPE